MTDAGIHTAKVAGQTLHLHPFRAAYWVEAEALLLADLHLGKAQHFRRAGIPVPQGVSDADEDRMISLLLDFRPVRVIFLGDLFHSTYNAQWDHFSDLLARFPDIRFELVVGNHDILAPDHYQRSGLILHPESLALGPFLFTHHPLEAVPDGCYNLAGHLHPSVRLAGGARQRLRLPCFYFNSRQGLLPAFGAFTGTATITPSGGDQVFVIAGDRVMSVG